MNSPWQARARFSEPHEYQSFLMLIQISIFRVQDQVWRARQRRLGAITKYLAPPEQLDAAIADLQRGLYDRRLLLSRLRPPAAIPALVSPAAESLVHSGPGGPGTRRDAGW